MSSAYIQLLVLAGIAIFLILRLKNVLGTRDGFEKPTANDDTPNETEVRRPNFEVIEGGIDHDISDHTDVNGKTGKALAAMKRAEPEFGVTEFLNGARGAYEMILIAFEHADTDTLKQFLSDEVFDGFNSVIKTRAAEDLHVDANFIGVSELKLEAAEFDNATSEGEITIRFVGEISSVVRNQEGEIVDGHPDEVKRQKDIWTFSRTMGSDDPNWILVATGG